ncbi:N-methyl-L-tryptophan oxidase [Paenibacillus rigui]|uniref:N-methyltryptophan oxidase n=1 Tax=Paenibacillus rigui TaxID=554312 RepID=A0A229US10_9BACL|nr:N-methyl-L-tryptophan oxidase [Paenibacillus rigui]OXM86208.1 N-methyltryptophan oxidase [Paenibacillus rigui]
MRTSYDVIIVGAGSMGMSAGYYLARQGVKVLLLDAFDPPHTSGSHHGDTRLLRHAYTGAPVYTELALRSDQLWRELEQVSGEPLVIRSGVLNLGPAKAPGLEAKLQRAADYKLAVEALDAAAMESRWPGLQLPDSYIGVYEKEAGYVRSEACVRAFRQQAAAHSADMLPFTPVTRLESVSQGVAVHTLDKGTYTAKHVVLSLGAWFGVLQDTIRLPIRAVRKAVAWFEAEEPMFDVERFPGFTIGGGDGGYYGFPSSCGSGVKIGRHDGGQAWLPGEAFEPFGHYAEDEQDVRRALEMFMPRAAGRVLRGAVCKYEMTPDEHFIIDRHPDNERIVLAGGFSGHGFKFASAIGEMISDLVTKGSTGFDVTPFALSRFR